MSKIQIPQNLKAAIAEIQDRNPGVVIIGIDQEMDSSKGIDQMFPVFHKKCAGVAFYYEHELTQDARLLAKKARLLDGSRPEPTQGIICGSCKEATHPYDLTSKKPNR